MNSPDASGSVWAIVVTYNRKEALAVCLRALLNQTRRVDKVLVIDNASTDGTAEFLGSGEYSSRSDLLHLQLPDNRGGAGGFYEGFKHAYEAGADWLWAMDDDGYPDEAALEILLSAKAGPFTGPLVLATDDPSAQTLAFPNSVTTGGQSVFLQTRDQAAKMAVENVVSGYICAFNGVLISREVITRIGLPNPGFFIWGDEWDFVFRARKLGIATTTVTTALFFHPANRTKYERMHLGRYNWDVPLADTPFRAYLLIRNHAYIARHHRGILAWLRHTVKYLHYLSVRRHSVTPLQALRYCVEGFCGELKGHKTFPK
jgi:rhamnopyranosyl-N-acetylglucosaminyl-diphospho-decaprenol beta-1,3/1,4-galactofuranosyltransferase